MAGFIPIMGRATHNLDSKNRIFIPAKHREALGANFVIFPNIKDRRSLVISSVEYLEELMRKIKESPKLTGKEKSQMINYLNGNGDTLRDIVDRHGGGDGKIVDALYGMLVGESDARTSLAKSVESHLMGIAAEQSRKAGGALVRVHP